MKKAVSVQIPESLVAALAELAKKTGRKKNLLIAASLDSFLKADERNQEEAIRRYLEACRDSDSKSQ